MQRQKIDQLSGEVINLSEHEYTAERDRLINELLEIEKTEAAIIERKRYLRLQIAQLCFGFNGGEKSGIEYVYLNNGWRLRATFNTQLSLPTSNNSNEVVTMLNYLASFGSEGLYAAQNVVNWKPALNTQQYKQLPANLKKVVDSVVKRNVQLPKIELVEP